MVCAPIAALSQSGDREISDARELERALFFTGHLLLLTISLRYHGQACAQKAKDGPPC